MKKSKNTKIILITLIIVWFILVLIVCTNSSYSKEETTTTTRTTSETTSTNSTSVVITKSINTTTKTTTESITGIPDYNGSGYIELNSNKPLFNDSDYTTTSFENYSNLDSLGRCGVAYSNIGTDLMPTEKRGSISNVKPSGWQSVKYDNVPGKYLYNRCHLIGYQLTGENDNEKNLITCTRYMNATTMLYFEDMTANYIKKTSNHVLYRVTPIYDGDNLVAKGVQMEASSVEDKCSSLCFNVFVYNIQDGIKIDYKTGDSERS